MKAKTVNSAFSLARVSGNSSVQSEVEAACSLKSGIAVSLLRIDFWLRRIY
jgi:hypothetical protein